MKVNVNNITDKDVIPVFQYMEEGHLVTENTTLVVYSISQKKWVVANTANNPIGMLNWISKIPQAIHSLRLSVLI